VRARATTKTIESADDIEGFQQIEEDDKKELVNLIKSRDAAKAGKTNKASKNDSTEDKKKTTQKRKSTNQKISSDTDSVSEDEDDDKPVQAKKLKESKTNDSKDNKFETFQLICKKIADESSHLKKTSILAEFLKDGIDKSRIFYLNLINLIIIKFFLIKKRVLMGIVIYL
jgi:DNA ligase-3